MRDESKRLVRERKTVTAMIRLYCRNQHETAGELCAECEALRAYAMGRLDRCTYAGQKPTCARCPVHCYKPAMRERMRGVMRYAGPRMLLHHPIMAFWHLLDGRVKPPPLPAKSRR